MVSFRHRSRIKVPGLRLHAFTMIEGIVSMVILSIMLSVAILVSLNLYRSMPRYKVQHMQQRLQNQMDSLVAVPEVDGITYRLGEYELTYTTEVDRRFTNMRMAYGSLSDSLGNQVDHQQLFLSYESKD